MRVSGTESRNVGNLEFPKINQEFVDQDLKKGSTIPNQANDAANVTISKEGLKSYRDNVLKAERELLSGSGVILTDYRTMISSRLPSTYGEQDANGEYTRVYQSIHDQADNLLKAYAEAYDEIQKGYEEGTREAFVEDGSSSAGYRKLTKDEELDALEKAYMDHVTLFEKRNNKDIIAGLETHAKKVASISSGRAKVTGAASKELEDRKAELDGLSQTIGKSMKEASKLFTERYNAQKPGTFNVADILRKISIFGDK